MRSAGRWRAAAGAGVALSVALVLVVAWRAGERHATAYAVRTAATVASYLAVVTPPARDRGAGYDLGPLLVQARGLATLPGLGADVEVYHRTAPLVRATAPALAPEVLDALRRRETTQWRDGRALVPFRDRDDWDVVGAVAVRPRRPATPLRSPALLTGALLALAAGWGAVRAVGRGDRGGRGSRRALLVYAAGALALGIGAYVGVWSAARASTDRWLSDARLLVQDVAARAPRGRVVLANLVRVARGATLAAGDSAVLAPRRQRSARGPGAVVAVRIGGGRWLELRTVPAETLTHGWLVVLVALALAGPAVAAVAHWGEGAAARPRELRETAAAWAFAGPAAVHLAIFAVAPMFFVLYLSAHRWSSVDPVKPFVGLANFVEMVRDPLVWTSLRNTALYALYVPVTMALGLGAALMLHRGRRDASLARTVLCMPAVSSVVALALAWQWMYHADLGLINRLVSLVGFQPVDWLGQPRTALLALMVVSAWVQVGYQIVVFLAGLRGIPVVYLDAARVDGADAWQRFRYVTWPLLKPVTLFVLVTGIIGSFQMFTYAYVVTGGGPVHATDVIVYRIYETAWESLRLGYAGALSVLLFTILFGATWMQFRLLARHVEYA